VRARVIDPRHGIYGPGSAAWRLQRESLVFVGGGRAALMQLAHPFVAYAIDQHSKTRDDVVGRFQRTFDNVFAMTFGTVDDAFIAARRVHAIHTRITGVIPDAIGAFPAGTRYHANDVDSLRWVYATLIDTVVLVTERLRGPLTDADKDAYYRDTWSFARLFGIPDAHLPPDWPAFRRYVDAMVASSILTVAPVAKDMSRFLFGAGPGQRQTRAAAIVERVTTELLPPRLRDQFGLPSTWRSRATLAALAAAARPGLRVMPRALRYLPAYVDARRRLSGQPPSGLAAWIDRRMTALAGHVAGRRGDQAS